MDINFHPDTWVIWENAHIQVEVGIAKLLSPSETLFCILKNFNESLPVFNTEEPKEHEDSDTATEKESENRVPSRKREKA